jgi:hypothetical protein
VLVPPRRAPTPLLKAERVASLPQPAPSARLVSSWCWPGVAGPSRKGIAREHKAQVYVRGRVHGRTLSRSLSMCVPYLSLCVLTRPAGPCALHTCALMYRHKGTR